MLERLLNGYARAGGAPGVFGLLEPGPDLRLPLRAGRDRERVEPGQPAVEQGEHVGGIGGAELLLVVDRDVDRRCVRGHVDRPAVPHLEHAQAARGQPTAACHAAPSCASSARSVPASALSSATTLPLHDDLQHVERRHRARLRLTSSVPPPAGRAMPSPGLCLRPSGR